MSLRINAEQSSILILFYAACRSGGVHALLRTAPGSWLRLLLPTCFHNPPLVRVQTETSWR